MNHDLKLIADKLGQAENLAVTIDPMTAFTLVGLLQLALRHPTMQTGGYGSRSAESLGRQIQNALGEIDPVISEALEIGWKPELDMNEEEYKTAYPVE